MKAWLKEFSAQLCVGLSLLVITLGIWLVTKCYATEDKLNVEVKTQEVKHQNIDGTIVEIKNSLGRIEDKLGTK